MEKEELIAYLRRIPVAGAVLVAGLSVAAGLVESWRMAGMVGVAGAFLVTLVPMIHTVLGAHGAFHHRRERRRTQVEAMHRAVEGALEEAKASYWQGCHFGKTELQHDWEWRRLRLELANDLREELPDKGDLVEDVEIVYQLQTRTEEAIAADPYWITYSYELSPREYRDYCQLVLENSHWVVASPGPSCRFTGDLVGNNGNLLAAFLVWKGPEPITLQVLQDFARHASQMEGAHAVLVSEDVVPPEVRPELATLGVTRVHHDDLSSLKLQLAPIWAQRTAGST